MELDPAGLQASRDSGRPRPAGVLDGNAAAPALLSIDLEDYFQVEAFRSIVQRDDWEWYPARVARNVRKLLEILARHEARATWFVLGWIADRYPDLVREIAEAGHEIACHSYHHRRVDSLDPERFAEDTALAVEAIGSACGARPAGYRAPSFSIGKENLWALEVLAAHGFRYDSSIFPVYRRCRLPAAPTEPFVALTPGGDLLELPPATLRVGRLRIPLAGGAYWRHLPFVLVRWGLRRMTRAHRRPAVLYLHPWELDPGQPRLPVGPVTRVRHYRNLSRMETRLDALLSVLRAMPIGEWLASPESRHHAVYSVRGNALVPGWAAAGTAAP